MKTEYTSSFSPGAAGTTRGRKVSAGVCRSVSRDEVACRSGHLELLSWIYCVGGGRGRVAPTPLNTRTLLVSDTEQMLAAQTDPCQTLTGGQRSRVEGGA